MMPFDLVALASFVLLIILIVVNFKEIKKHFSRINRNVWLIVISIFILGLYLRTAIPICDANDTLIWEHVFVGKDILEGGNRPRGMTQPIGYPLLLSIVFLISGVSYASLITFNLLLSSLTLTIVFLISYIITKDEMSSIFSMLFLALFPMSIIFSQYGATEITSVFFVTLSVLFLVISLESRSTKMFLLVFVSLALSCYMRLENIFIFTSLFIICYVILIKNKRELKKLLVPIMVFALLSIPIYFLISRGEETFGKYPEQFPPDFDWDFYRETFSIKYLPENLIFTIDKFLNSSLYPAMLYFFVIISLVFIRRFTKLAVPVLWVVLSLLFFGRFWALKFVNPDLYLINIHPALSILYGIGIISVFHLLSKRFFPDKPFAKILLLSLLLLVTLYPNAQILLHTKYGAKTCYSKDIYNAGNRLDGCIISEETGPVFDLKEMVKFILPGKDIYNGTTECKEGYFIKVIDEQFFETIFSTPSKTNIFENCTLYNMTENFESLDIYRFSCVQPAS
jgi:4-amino-4-deoxy-L-arabinose transferase-like glycosyltransferase